MSMMVKNNSLLLEMIKDMSEAEEKYRPDNYWMFYIEKIVKQLKNNDLNEFRNLNGGGGSGSVAAYSGGSKEFYTYKFGWNFHPLEDDFKKFDNNFIVKKFNRLIDKLSIYFTPIKFLSFRSAITRIYYEAAVQQIQNLVYDNVALLDKNKLFALNFSATQELDRKVIALESENAELKARLEKLEVFLGL